MASYEDDDLPHKLINDAQLMLLFSEEAEKYTDATVTCKGIEWKVQQSILCTRCPFFKACFQAGTFKEGETKTVDFGDDEPYAVEALLIYLYTFEYLNRKSQKFEEPLPKTKKYAPPARLLVAGPTLRGDTRRVMSPRKKIGARSVVPVASPVVLSGPLVKSEPFKLKSEAPGELWQERLALYRIAHRLEVRNLCKTSLRIMIKELDSALFGIDVSQHVREVYNLHQDEARSLKEEVARKIAEQEPWYIRQDQLDSLMQSCWLFSSNLVIAMREKDKNQAEKIAEQHYMIDRLEGEIAEKERIMAHDNWPST